MDSMAQSAAKIREKKAFLIDMDGVIYHFNQLLPGAKEFVQFLLQENKQFLFLTNSSVSLLLPFSYLSLLPKGTIAP